MYCTEMLNTLRGVRFLHDFTDDYLWPIVPIAEVVDLSPGAVLFREGQGHSKFYLVLRGSVALEVRVSTEEAKRLQTVGEGELLGWSPALGQFQMTATARVMRPTKLIAIDAPQLLAICEHNPKFGFEFMRRTAQALSNRLSATKLQLLDVYRHELPAVPVAGQEG